MKRAIISDIHSNLEALEAVLKDIQAQGVEEIYCLGDIVGYGPNPRECIDLVMRHCKVSLLGNHDQGALFDPEGFNVGAEKAIFWTRAQLEENFGNPAESLKRWDYLGERPRIHKEGNIIYVHGSVRNPLNEYVFPEDIYSPAKLQKLFSLIEKCAFQGHTHTPGVFTEQCEFFTPEELPNNTFDLNSVSKAMVNVGSVGQPRDGDPRACYVIQDDQRVIFRRVPYEVEVTREKIYVIPELDNFLGDRLREGR
ncbi:MAG: metallophosphoesterase family protein [Thermogutta sp.]